MEAPFSVLMHGGFVSKRPAPVTDPESHCIRGNFHVAESTPRFQMFKVDEAKEPFQLKCVLNIGNLDNLFKGGSSGWTVTFRPGLHARRPD